MRNIVALMLALAVCSEWASGSFIYGSSRKCEDENVVCYQTSGGYGVAMSCFQKPQGGLYE